MTQPQHTPGPWEIKRNAANRHTWSIYAVANRPNGLAIAIANTAHWLPSDPEGESEANARLIAAAPDTLDLVVAIEDALRAHIASNIPMNRAQMFGWCERLRAAITKATKQEPDDVQA